MSMETTIWRTPGEYLARMGAQEPVLFFAPEVLQQTARRFQDGFAGLVTYAVKANPDPLVIDNLAAAGINAFDVASPEEIRLIRRRVPGAALHYNNPVRSRREIAEGVAAGVVSWSVDSESELDKLFAQLPSRDNEIAVRFKLPVKGAAYDFGAKFGAMPDRAAALLGRAVARGHAGALTFHPGTQCADPAAWATYIRAAAGIAAQAGVRLARLNVGGGFPSHRAAGDAPALEEIFAVIAAETKAAFGAQAPELVCEPGRAMVAEAFTLACEVRAVRDDGDVFLNDGIYGALSESPLLGAPGRIEVRRADGTLRDGPVRPRVVFGPTCDSVDRLPGMIELPADIAEGDVLLLRGMGAYSTVTNTRFNGFGALSIAMVRASGG